MCAVCRAYVNGAMLCVWYQGQWPKECRRLVHECVIGLLRCYNILCAGPEAAAATAAFVFVYRPCSYTMRATRCSYDDAIINERFFSCSPLKTIDNFRLTDFTGEEEKNIIIRANDAD